jgi:hypothetical protein
MRPDSIPVLLRTASYHYLLTRAQRVIDPANRRAPHTFCDLIKPV